MGQEKEIVIQVEHKFECPVHGIVSEPEVMHMLLPGVQGFYCMKCWIETLQKVNHVKAEQVCPS
jgi:hypothetical protein